MTMIFVFKKGSIALAMVRSIRSVPPPAEEKQAIFIGRCGQDFLATEWLSEQLSSVNREIKIENKPAKSRIFL